MIFEDDRNAGALRLVMNVGEGLAKARHQTIIRLGEQRVSAPGADADPARAKLGSPVDHRRVGQNGEIDHMRRGACEIDIAAGEIEVPRAISCGIL